MQYTICAHDVPDCIRDVSIDWYEGKSSAMYAVAYRHSQGNRAVSLSRLLREVRECLNGLSGNLAGKEQPRLKVAEAWCADQIKRAKASAELRRCLARAKAAGLDCDAISKIVNGKQ